MEALVADKLIQALTEVTAVIEIIKQSLGKIHGNIYAYLF